jgi:4-amino-4-deoxy-L-arabinose transferase-like glycosyltransferase
MRLRGDAGVSAAIAVLLVLRLIAGAVLPLSADEAYYWLWSRHPAWGYFDHPPVVAFLIAAGTRLFGDTAFGVRVFGILLSFAASWFVWRGAERLYGEARGAPAALLFNLTLMVGVESLAATPDAPAIFTAAAFFWALAEFTQTRNGRWWLAAGAAAGLGMLSKYTTPFLGAGAVLWLAAVPSLRRHLRSPWPYAGAALALLIFLPNLMWNANHDWATFAFQFGRVDAGGFAVKYIFDFVGAQIVLATPFVLVLAIFGLIVKPADEKRFLAPALVLPAVLYFIVHALHARVQGNWPCFLYPVLAAAAADALRNDGAAGWRGSLKKWSGRLAVPVAATLLIAAYAQALFGVVPMGRKDPMARLLAAGLPEVAKKVEDLRLANHAGAILTTDYATVSWFSFYSPARPPVALIGEEYRFADSPPLSPTLLRKPMLYVCEDHNNKCDRREEIAAHFDTVTQIARLDRKRKGAVIAQYVVYRVEGAKDGSIGRVP